MIAIGEERDEFISARSGTVVDIARRLGTSPFHLCRVFRELTGQTMHEYRTQLQVRDSLERLEDDLTSNHPNQGCRLREHDFAAQLPVLACEVGFALETGAVWRSGPSDRTW